MVIMDRREDSKNLAEMCEAIDELTMQVQSIDDNLSSITSRFEEHERSDSVTHAEMIKVVGENTKSLNNLVASTETLISIQANAEGFINTTKHIGNLMIWCGKFGSLIGALVFVIITIKDKVS